MQRLEPGLDLSLLLFESNSKNQTSIILLLNIIFHFNKSYYKISG